MFKTDTHEKSTSEPPSVAILLCTYNGAPYLASQLDSFGTQTHKNWRVWASDDGSKDDTLSILKAYQLKWSTDRLSICTGPSRGFAANFLSLVCRPDIAADYYAYSDQDDIWEKEKLARALEHLQALPHDVPALYCSRTLLVNSDDEAIGFSPRFTKPPSFANALVQNIGGGNTMVFNRAAQQLLYRAGTELPLVIHDWWTYMLITGCGGTVLYDSTATLRYRQHNQNLIGANNSWQARIKRLSMLLQGRFGHWNESNTQALRQMEAWLTSENRETLEYFTRARRLSLIPRLINLKRSGVYRQTAMGNLGLIMAAIFKKL